MGFSRCFRLSTLVSPPRARSFALWEAGCKSVGETRAGTIRKWKAQELAEWERLQRLEERLTHGEEELSELENALEEQLGLLVDAGLVRGLVDIGLVGMPPAR